MSQNMRETQSGENLEGLLGINNQNGEDALLEEKSDMNTGSNVNLEDIMLLLNKVTDIDWFDKIVSAAQDRKSYLTEEIIEKGDIITLSKKCSSVMSPYIGHRIVVDSIDRDGRYHVTIGGMETILSREKILLIAKKEV